MNSLTTNILGLVTKSRRGFIPIFEYGEVTIALTDVLDVIIVGFLLYQIYRLVKGNLAANIVIGLVLIYLLTLLADFLEMEFLGLILNTFVDFGAVVVIILFQPEIRRFLLQLGKRSKWDQSRSFLAKISPLKWTVSQKREVVIQEIIKAVQEMSKTKTGCLLVYTNATNEKYFDGSGTILDSEISAGLLKTLFFKNSPLHDGAVIIADGRILSAGVILPLSDSEKLASNVGLRHRAGLGASERIEGVVVLVSEETGWIGYAQKGNLHKNVTISQLSKVLYEASYHLSLKNKG